MTTLGRPTARVSLPAVQWSLLGCSPTLAPQHLSGTPSCHLGLALEFSSGYWRKPPSIPPCYQYTNGISNAWSKSHWIIWISQESIMWHQPTANDMWTKKLCEESRLTITFKSERCFATFCAGNRKLWLRRVRFTFASQPGDRGDRRDECWGYVPKCL